jgi:glutaredoxin
VVSIPDRAADGGSQSVTVYVGRGCHLCEAALAVVERVRAELSFPLTVVDITGLDDLERRYREALPVVEIDGERVFTFFVTSAGLRARIAARAT